MSNKSKQVMEGIAWGVLGGVFAVAAVLASVYLSEVITKRNSIQTPTIPISELARTSAVMVDTGRGRGSAGYIGNGLFLTAGHVCQLRLAKNFVLITPDKFKIKVSQITLSPKYPSVDLCLIKAIETPELSAHVKAVGLDDATPEVAVGSTVYSGGFSGGKPYSFRAGMVYKNEVSETSAYASVGYPIAQLNVEIANFSVEPGASGSATVDASGQLRGVVIISSPTEGALMVPLKVIREFLKENGVALQHAGA
jgi:S1-C subfamily serine protease